MAWSDDCIGSVEFTIDEDFQIDGIGSCTAGILGFTYLIEGTQSDTVVAGDLVAENETDRVETPFTGSRDADGVVVSFDTVHESAGQRVRLFGTITAAVVE